MAHVSSLARRASESSLPQNESKAMHAPDPASDGRTGDERRACDGDPRGRVVRRPFARS